MKHNIPPAQLSLSPSRSGGTTGDQTGGCGSKRLEIINEILELKVKIDEVDIILNSFGTNERQLIEMKYMERFNKDSWGNLNGCQVYYRMKDELFIMATQMLGYVKREQIRFEELGW